MTAARASERQPFGLRLPGSAGLPATPDGRGASDFPRPAAKLGPQITDLTVELGQ